MKSREARKVTCNDEFHTVVINSVIVFTSEYNSAFRFLHFYWEGKNLCNICIFSGRFVAARGLPAFPPEFPSRAAGGALGWVCISVCQKRSVPVLKGNLGQGLTEPGPRERQFPPKWFSRWDWRWVPARTLTPLTVFSPVYSAFSRDGFVDCFSGCCLDSR